jgi:hypothetical protein
MEGMPGETFLGCVFVCLEIEEIGLEVDEVGEEVDEEVDEEVEPEPSGFACATDGQTISPELQCDGMVQCSDGSDEEGCAELICP